MSERERFRRSMWDLTLQDQKIRTLDDLLPHLPRMDGEMDRSGDWPALQLHALWRVGALAWALPREYGGEELSSLELHLRYERLASVSLTLALILSQRDSARDWPRRGRMLSQLAKNEWFSTIGIAQLTTSRQHGKPALVARRNGPDWRLDGMIPWCTGADIANFIIAGAVTDDGKQILFSLPANTAGMEVDRPMDLVALGASWTSSIKLKNVPLESKYVLRGPVDKALVGRKGVPLPQAFLAMGLCRSAIDLIRKHTSDLAQKTARRLEDRLEELRKQVIDLCREDRAEDAARKGPALRAELAELAVRATHSAVALYKGSALVRTHRAQQLAREAMFLLVWSCPDPVIEQTVQHLCDGAP